MPSAAHRLLRIALLAGWAFSSTLAQGRERVAEVATVRTAPTRPSQSQAAKPAAKPAAKAKAKAPAASPAPKAATASAVKSKPVATRLATSGVPTRKFGKIDYVKLADGAKQLGLKLTKYDRGRRVILLGTGVSAEIEADTRDVTINSMRVLLGDPTLDTGGDIFMSRVDYERVLTPLLKPGFGALSRPVPGTRVIVLDPGHGGKDQGTSKNEKVYALDVAKRAKRLLDAAGFRTILTRDDDTYLTLPERPAVAHAHKADLFVSIHFNAIANDRTTSGVEVYTFPPQGQRGTGAWSPLLKSDAEQEASPVNRHDYWSSALAHAIHRRFVGDLKAYDRGKKLMHLGVLRSLKCPGVLVECGFLTSTAEAAKIAVPAYREKLAESIVRGIRDYAATVDKARKQG